MSETAWPALIAALRRAENAGYDPAVALSSVASARELHTACSVSEILAWRIGRHLAALAVTANGFPGGRPDESPAPDPRQVPAASPVHVDFAAPEGRTSAWVLPWLANPQAGTAGNGNVQLDVYLQDAVALIVTRVSELAESAVRHRPPWMSLLGQPPADPHRAREWHRHVGVIAAYRDQHKITTDDPLPILGPYAEPGHAGHTAYWHAAESVLTARRLSGLEPGTEASPDGPARATLAADIYRALPDDEREAVAALIAAQPGPVWLGDPSGPDQNGAAHPIYARHMITVLARHGYLSEGGIEPQRDRPGFRDEPVEAAFARRERTQRGTAARARRPDAVPRHGSTANCELEPEIPPQRSISAPYPTPVR